MRQLVNRLVSLVAPPICAVCRSGCDPGRLICARCVSSLERAPLGARRRGVGLSRVSAAFMHEGAARSMVASLKFSGAVALAGPMAELMLERIGAELTGSDWLVPAPANPARLRGRGYNQSLLLATELSRLSGTPVVDCLVRRGWARPQSELGRSERLAMDPESIAFDQRAFRRASSNALAEFPTNVVVCDDVTTTTVTLEVCAQALRRSQAGQSLRSIRAVTFASASATRPAQTRG